MSNTPSAPCGGAGFSGRRARATFRRQRPCCIIAAPGFFFSRETNQPRGFLFFNGIPRLDAVGFFAPDEPGPPDQWRTQCYADEFTNESRDEYSPGGRPGYRGHKLRKKMQNPSGGPGGRRMWRLNRRTMRLNPAHTRKAGRGFLRRSTTKPWCGRAAWPPQGQRARNRGRNQTDGSNRQFRFCWTEFPGQFVVFPIPVSDVREIERKRNFEGGGKPRH